MPKRRPQAERIKDDFHNSRKLGEVSTERLLDLLIDLCDDIDAIQSDIEFLKRNGKKP